MASGSGHFWIRFNVVLFSGYAVFSVPSFFWPTVLKDAWTVLLHLLTLLVELAIVYGLVKRILWTNYLIAMVAPLMIAHLIIFTLVPLGIQLAYIGPSRAFYTLFIQVVSRLGGGRGVFYSLTALHLTLSVIHLINLWYFLRRKVADRFRELP